MGFSVQMKEFLQVSTCRYDNVKELCKKMKKQVLENRDLKLNNYF